MGAFLATHAKGQRGILKSAYEKNVPVFVPAFTDSELGLDYALTNRERARDKKPLLRFDPFIDLEYFAETLLKQKRLGIFTIGGGVPRNWSQQFGPFIELRHRRGGEDVPLKRYHYGLRICPEPVYWGGLSGSPYSEAISWGNSSRLRKAGNLAKSSLTLPSGYLSLWLRYLNGWTKTQVKKAPELYPPKQRSRSIGGITQARKGTTAFPPAVSGRCCCGFSHILIEALESC